MGTERAENNLVIQIIIFAIINNEAQYVQHEAREPPVADPEWATPLFDITVSKINTRVATRVLK
jgi:hypothetical protein